MVVKCPDRTTLHSTLNTRQMIPRSGVKDNIGPGLGTLYNDTT